MRDRRRKEKSLNKKKKMIAALSIFFVALAWLVTAGSVFYFFHLKAPKMEAERDAENQIQEDREAYDTDVKFQLRGKYKDYEAALLYLKNNGINLSKITPQYIKQLQRNVEQMQKDIEQVTAEKEKLQSDLNMLSVIQKNNREILPEHIIPHTQEPKKRREAQVR